MGQMTDEVGDCLKQDNPLIRNVSPLIVTKINESVYGFIRHLFC